MAIGWAGGVEAELSCVALVLIWIGVSLKIQACTFFLQRGGPLYIPLFPPPSDRSSPHLASIATGQTDVHILRPLSHVVWDRQCARQVLSLKANVKVVIGTVLMTD